MAAYNADGALTITLQDANYNVVGRTWDGGQLIGQYAYGPYGAFLTYPDPSDPSVEVPATEGSDGQPLNIDTLSLNHANWQFFAGAWLDKETGLYHMRARYYSPQHKRFISQDPKGQALVLARVLARNAQSMMAMASLSMRAQYGDGMNLYGYASENPIVGRDPSGQFTSIGQLAKVSISSGLIGMVVGSIGGAIGDALFNPDSTWESQLKAAGKGAVGGFVGGAASAGLVAWTGVGGLAGLV